MDQLQRSLMMQQQNDQLLASSLGASSNIQLPFQQQQLHPLGPLLQQTLQASLPLQLQPQLLLRGPGSANNVAPQPTRQEESEDEEESEPGDDSDTS